jgi:hypothetical protein
MRPSRLAASRARSRRVAEARAIRYDAKVEGGPGGGPGGGDERIYSHVRLVRGGDINFTTPEARL